MIKQRFCVDILCWQKYRRSSKFVTWDHTTRVVFRVKICVFKRSNEKNHFSKTKIYFHKKKYTTIIRTYWATKYGSRREKEFWATCHDISNLLDGCWHPLLRIWYVWQFLFILVFAVFIIFPICQRDKPSSP